MQRSNADDGDSCQQRLQSRQLPLTCFEVRVSKETFKFNAAHFVAFKGYRERLHGHNYQVSVKLLGSHKVFADGYVLDYGEVKSVTRAVCRELNEHFLCPTKSDVLDIQHLDVGDDEWIHRGGGSASVKITCEDGSVFIFPRDDCAFLPIVHATTEELAVYLWGKILEGLDPAVLRGRGIHTMEVTVAESPGQEAMFRYEIPEKLTCEDGVNCPFDVASFIADEGNGETRPCPSAPASNSDVSSVAVGQARSSLAAENSKSTSTARSCPERCDHCASQLSEKLQLLADAINTGALGGSQNTSKQEVTVGDLVAAMSPGAI